MEYLRKRGLNMMVNTYNGKCHTSADIISWLENSGIKTSFVVDLNTDSSVVIGTNNDEASFETVWR